MVIWAWVIVFGTVGALVALDLWVVHRPGRPTTRRGELTWACVYAVLALLGGAVIYVAYDRHWLNLGYGDNHGLKIDGPAAAGRYLTAFLWQLALDLDGVFVMSALFGHFRTPPEVRRRTLFLGIIPSLALRAGLIFLGAWLLGAFEWTRFLICGLLVLASIRMFLIRQENFDPERNWVVRVLRRFMPAPLAAAGPSLLVLLVLHETADAYIALDSVPAVLAASREPLLIVAANGAALLCLRSLYVVLEGVRDWLRYIKIGLACVLAYAAVLITFEPGHRSPPPVASLAVLVLSVGAGLVLGLLSRRADQKAEVSALGEDADRVARLALRRARWVILSVVGMTLLLVGVVMIPGPGPGLPLIFIALAILANEFVWAKRLLTKYRGQVERAARISAAKARERLSPWVMLPLIGGTIAFFTYLHLVWNIKLAGVLVSGIFVLLGQLAWGYLAFVHKHGPDQSDPPS